MLDQQEQVARKFVVEQRKFIAEAATLDRDRFFAPFVVVATVGSRLLAAVLSHLWR